MWSRLLVVVALSCCAPSHANFAIYQTYTTSCPANDGSAGAPNATIQMPTLLNGYSTTIKTRLGCNVAGVNYAVGYPTSTSLQDPAGGGLPSGVAYTTNTHCGGTVNMPCLTFSGSSAITLNGWDLSLHGGVAIDIQSTGGGTIENSKIACPYGLTTGEIHFESGAGGDWSINNNVFNGNGAYCGQGIEFIYNVGATNLTVEYNDINNFDSGVIAIDHDGALTYKYNLIRYGASNPGEHLNLLEYSLNGATNSVVAQFNTVYQPTNGSPGGEALQFYNNAAGSPPCSSTCTLTSADIGYNTLISASTNPNAIARANSTAYVDGTVFSVAGQAFPYYTVCTATWTSGGHACTGGGNGATCTTAGSLPAGYGSATLDTTFSDGTCSVQGSNYAVSYFLHGSNDSTYVTKMTPGPATVHDNYFDFSAALNGDSTCSNGGQSAFYPGTWRTVNGPSGTVAWTAPNANYDMTSGSQIACNSSYP